MNDSTRSEETPPELPNVPAFVEILNRNHVRYVIIGGSAAQFSVPGLVTYDVDFTPATDPDNLERLSAALDDLGARIRAAGIPQGLAFDHNGPSLARARIWNLQCRYGAFDITFEPSGGGYEHLAQRARVVTVRGVAFPVADLADIVASKTLANRAKDQLVLPALNQALRDRDNQVAEEGTSKGLPGAEHSSSRRTDSSQVKVDLSSPGAMGKRRPTDQPGHHAETVVVAVQ